MRNNASLPILSLEVGVDVHLSLTRYIAETDHDLDGAQRDSS